MNTNNKGLAYVSYIGIFALIPFFTEKNDEFVQYHAKQGVNLLICEAAFYIIFYVVINALSFFLSVLFDGALAPLLFLGALGFIPQIVGIVFFVISILGIVNVSKGVMQPLPIFGAIQIVK